MQDVTVGCVVESKAPLGQNVTLFGSGGFAEVTTLK